MRFQNDNFARFCRQKDIQNFFRLLHNNNLHNMYIQRRDKLNFVSSTIFFFYQFLESPFVYHFLKFMIKRSTLSTCINFLSALFTFEFFNYNSFLPRFLLYISDNSLPYSFNRG